MEITARRADHIERCSLSKEKNYGPRVHNYGEEKNGPRVHNYREERKADYHTKRITPEPEKNGPRVHFSEMKEDNTMLKIRLMGTKKEIKWFRRILERCRDLQILEFSDLYTNKGTDRFYRCYVEVERAEKARQSLNKNHTVSGTNQ